MQYVQSSVFVSVPTFDIPKTKEAYEQLTVMQKSVLAQENPDIYERFAHPPQPKKPWE